MEPQLTSSNGARRPGAGLGWGAVVGAASGVAAAVVFVVVLFVSIVAAEGPAEVVNDEDVFVFSLIYGLVGSLVGALVGSVVGALCGLVFGATRSEGLARLIAPVISVIPFVIGPRMLEEEGWTVGFVVGMVIVAIAYAGLGWMAGWVFATKLRETDVAAAGSRVAAFPT